MFRWWDGTTWTTMVTPDPTGQFRGEAAGGQSYRGGGGPQPGSLPIHSAQQLSHDYGQITQQRPSSRRPLVVLVLVGLLVVALLWGGVTLLTRIVGNPFTGAQPASNPTLDVCPTQTLDEESPAPHINPAGRVQGGKLSYPLLGSPWGTVQQEDRLAFGRDVYGQLVPVEPNYDGVHSWVASVLVGELVAGDGFFSPQEGSEIVTRCILGSFYGDARVGREDRVNQATTLDGYDAWLVEMHLTFSIPNLRETGETAIVLIVSTSEESSSIFYASIPDSRPELLTTARQLQEQLRVES